MATKDLKDEKSIVPNLDKFEPLMCWRDDIMWVLKCKLVNTKRREHQSKNELSKCAPRWQEWIILNTSSLLENNSKQWIIANLKLEGAGMWKQCLLVNGIQFEESHDKSPIVIKILHALGLWLLLYENLKWFSVHCRDDILNVFNILCLTTLLKI